MLSVARDPRSGARGAVEAPHTRPQRPKPNEEFPLPRHASHRATSFILTPAHAPVRLIPACCHPDRSGSTASEVEGPCVISTDTKRRNLLFASTAVFADLLNHSRAKDCTLTPAMAKNSFRRLAAAPLPPAATLRDLHFARARLERGKQV